MTIAHLEDRSLLEVGGTDRKKFLQGLITNDINKASEENLIYSTMLDPQGRFLYDFFIFEREEKLLIDCSLERRDEILQQFNFYKLRSKIEIKKNDKIRIFWGLEKKDYSPHVLEFKDPRKTKMGFRIYSENEPKNDSEKTTSDKLNSYEFHRISLKIPESEKDLTYKKSFILEFGFDELNAVDYQKGCYVGQEPTARIHHLGEIRKEIFRIEIENDEDFRPLKGMEITCEGKSAGIVLSSILHENRIHALALIKNQSDQNDDFKNKLRIGNKKIHLLYQGSFKTG